MTNLCSPRVTDASATSRFTHEAVTTSNALHTSAADHHDDHDDHSSAAHDDDDHDDAPGSGTAGPSPAESVGCEPHGNHWHCDGPASTTVGTTASAAESSVADDATASTSPSPVETGAAMANGIKMGFAAMLAGAAGVMAL
jgi:hypothetical protein